MKRESASKFCFTRSIISVVLFLSVPALWPISADSHLSPQNLKCEWRTNPAGIASDHPHFSWTLTDSDLKERGAKQTAYQIIIASSLPGLFSRDGNRWDSGKVSSSQMFQIEYAGKTLVSATHYHWKVRVWDQSDRASSWSPAADFITALRGETRWSAHWIAAEPDSSPLPQARENIGIRESPSKPLPIFRHDFSPSRKISEAIVYVSGLGQYELHINGQNVTKNLLTPGWTNYRKRVFYNTYDVTKLVRPGVNAIGILMGNGMYNAPAAEGRYSKFSGSFGQPKLILQMHLQYVGAPEEVIISDSTWKTAPGPITFTNVYGGEDYDARKEQLGWDSPGFHDSDWQTALEVAGPGGELVAEQAPPIQVMHTYRPVRVTRPRQGIAVYDLGQNFSGWPEVKVRGRGGSSVKLVAGELLDPSGLVTQHSANASPDSQNRYSYILSGKGDETWYPRFSSYGFRYVQVESSPLENPGDAPIVVSLIGQFIHDNVSTVGHFKTSNRLFTQIHQLIDMAMLSNMVSVLTDCPHREKLGWLEQTHLAGPSIFFNYDAITLYQKIAQDIRDSQLDDGMVPGIAPEYVAFVDKDGANTDFRDSPEWGSAGILTPWTAYQFYGDTNLLATQYPTMQAYAAYLKGKGSDHLLSYGLGDWYDIGPGEPGKSQLTGKYLTATAIYFQDLTVLGKVAALLGKSADSITYANEAKQVKAAFNDKLFHPESGLYDRGSQTANAMPLALGMVPVGRESDVLQHLVEDIRRHGDHVTAGDIGFHYVVRALMDGGRSDVLYDMLSRSDSPSYGYQVSRGATTLTEAWDTNPASSQNHFMLGHGEEWFYRGLAGIHIDFDRPEQERIQIRPAPVGEIASASATYDSVFGEIGSSWTLQNKHFTLHVTVPPNYTARVEIPASSVASVTEAGLPLDRVSGISAVRVLRDAVSVQVESGNYIFSSEI